MSKAKIARNRPSIATPSGDDRPETILTTSPISSRERDLRVVAFALLFGLASVLIYWCYVLQFSGFQQYDDEGYVLLTLRQFMHGLPLYDQLFTQYGPFHFVLRSFLHVVTFTQVNHDNARIMSLILWTVSGITCGYFVFAVTRRPILAIAAYIQLTLYLVALTNEPGHPQETVLWLLMITLWIVALTPGLVPLKHALLALGLITGAMLLTKINIGVFFCASLLAFVVSGAPQSGSIARFKIPLLASLTAVPYAVMHRHALSSDYNYFFTATAGITLAMLVNWRLGVIFPFERTWMRWFLLGMGIVTAFTLIPIFVMGTTITGLIDGVIVDPARFSGVYHSTLPAAALGIVTSLLMLAIAVKYLFSSSLLGFSTEQTHKLIAAVKICVGLWGVYLGITDRVALITYLPACLWLLPAGLSGKKSTGRFRVVRLALMNLAAFQVMQAYPVTGSQVTWASFLLVLSSYVIFSDGLTEIAQAAGEPRPAVPLMSRLVAAIATCVAVLLFLSDRVGIDQLIHQFRLNSHLALQGATRLRIPAALKARYEYLTTNIQGRCDTLVTMPGMGSYNLWSRVPPPTGWNVTAWPLLIDNARQEMEVDKLRASARPCAILCLSCALNMAAPEPLVQYIRSELVPLASTQGFELRVPETSRRQDGSLSLLNGQMSFDGANDVFGVPTEALYKRFPLTIRMWFRAASAGGLLGGQAEPYRADPSQWEPLLYIGSDGRVRGGFYTGEVGVQMAGAATVTNNGWHQVVLVRRADQQALYVDGSLAGEIGPAVDQNMTSFQLGAAYTKFWPYGNQTWLRLRGIIRESKIFDRAWVSDDVARDIAASRPR